MLCKRRVCAVSFQIWKKLTVMLQQTAGEPQFSTSSLAFRMCRNVVWIKLLWMKLLLLCPERHLNPLYTRVTIRTLCDLWHVFGCLSLSTAPITMRKNLDLLQITIKNFEIFTRFHFNEPLMLTVFFMSSLSWPGIGEIYELIIDRVFKRFNDNCNQEIQGRRTFFTILAISILDKKTT